MAVMWELRRNFDGFSFGCQFLNYFALIFVGKGLVERLKIELLNIIHDLPCRSSRYGMYIEIVTTPNEKLKETGFGTLESCISVLESIKRLGYLTRLSECKNLDDLKNIVQRKPDLVMLAVKYITVDQGERIWLSDFFNQNGINYSGSPRDAIRFDSNKVLAKTHLRNKGISTADYFTAIPGQYKYESELPFSFPLFLKPSDAANGNGVDDLSLVRNFHDFEDKISALYAQFGLPILVETYLDGPEFTVSIIKKSDGSLLVSTIEIVPPVSGNGLRILGSKTKTDDSELLKKTENAEVTHNVSELAVDAFLGLGARDYGRIDIKTNEAGDCFFMEANLVPGMTQGSSYFPKACEIEGELSYDKVVGLMIDAGLRRGAAANIANVIVKNKVQETSIAFCLH